MEEASRRPFGQAPTGQPVELLTLDNGRVRCEILTFGAALRSLEVPDRTGGRVDVVLGYGALEDYLRYDGYLGAVVGRYANRIAKGRFTLDGKEYALAVNSGPNHLHGGSVGFSHRVWQVEALERDRAVLALTSPDGEEGYPGDLTVRVTYRLDGSALELRYEAVSDKDTPCNLTNHSYFNLSGHASGPVLDQEIAIRAQRYTPTDGDSIPLGTIEPVEGTPMDLRTLTPIGAHIDDDFVQLRQAGQGRRGVRPPPRILPGDPVLSRLPQPAPIPLQHPARRGAVRPGDALRIFCPTGLRDHIADGAAGCGRLGP